MLQDISSLWPVHYIADPSPRFRLSGSIWGKRSLRFYRKHICRSVGIIERNHRRINILTEGKEKTQKEKEKKAATREAFSLEELTSRGSESRRLSLTHCNVSTFLSGGAASLSNFSRQRTRKIRRGKWRPIRSINFSRELKLLRILPPARRLAHLFAFGRSVKIVLLCNHADLLL